MPDRDNFHSEDVQDILGRAPSWVARWGVTAVFAIFGGVLLGCYFIKYPDIIESPVEITTYNPPVDLITRYDGLIDTLCVRDGAMVESGASKFHHLVLARSKSVKRSTSSSMAIHIWSSGC